MKTWMNVLALLAALTLVSCSNEMSKNRTKNSAQTSSLNFAAEPTPDSSKEPLPPPFNPCPQGFKNIFSWPNQCEYSQVSATVQDLSVVNAEAVDCQPKRSGGYDFSVITCRAKDSRMTLVCTTSSSMKGHGEECEEKAGPNNFSNIQIVGSCPDRQAFVGVETGYQWTVQPRGTCDSRTQDQRNSICATQIEVARPPELAEKCSSSMGLPQYSSAEPANPKPGYYCCSKPKPQAAGPVNEVLPPQPIMLP